jgi:hypothetical protein
MTVKRYSGTRGTRAPKDRSEAELTRFLCDAVKAMFPKVKRPVPYKLLLDAPRKGAVEAVAVDVSTAQLDDAWAAHREANNNIRVWVTVKSPNERAIGSVHYATMSEPILVPFITKGVAALYDQIAQQLNEAIEAGQQDVQ